MLTVAKVTKTAAGGYADYLDAKAQPPALGDYYLQDGERTEAPGRWAGGAQLFELDPDVPVTGEQLRTLMDVRRPDTGSELRRAGGSGEAVAAIDATFSAPKSVSAVWALARPELRQQIEQAHETAIDRALVYATRQVPMLRRRVTRDVVVHEKATGLVATSWRHTTARAVDQQVPDPQLHSHVLLHAAVRRDRRLVAIDSRSWLVHRREVGAAYRTELAHELQALGFGVRRGTGRGGRYFELDTIPQTLLDRWSSRHHQVQAAIHQRLTDQQRALEVVVEAGGPAAGDARQQLKLLRTSGQLSPKQERTMATATRTSKAPVTVDDLDQHWRRTGLKLGVSRERIEVLRHQPHDALVAAPPDAVLAGLTEFDATFPARDARAVALEQSAGAPIADALEQLRQLRASDEILVLADRTGTTRLHRGQERAVVAITQRLTNQQIEPVPTAITARETDRLDHELAATGGRLSGEQRQAIELACGTRPLVLIEGHAGTGKSTTLTGIARAHQATGQRIIVTSTAALAAGRLATDLSHAGVDCTAYSTARLHAAISRGAVELGPDTTVIHDEAALASTREQLRLLHAIDTAGARLIEVGDPRQNQPVGAGGLWTDIDHAVHAAGARVQLTRNQRAQAAADRHAQALFRAGEIKQAIHGYHARGRVHFQDDQQRAEDRALDAAHLDRSSGKTTLVIAQTSNEHLDELNARAQAIRHQHRQLGDDSIPIPGRPYGLHAGDHIQVRHTIHDPDDWPLRNGTTAQITAVDAGQRELELELTDGRKLRLDEQQVAAGDIRLAYIQHPFLAQGQTTDTAHLIVAEHATREGSYVALTRARDQTHIHAASTTDRPPDGDRLHELADRLARTEPDLPSIRTPLAHETTIAAQSDARDDTSAPIPPDRQRSANHAAGRQTHSIEPDTLVACAARHDIQPAQRVTSRARDTVRHAEHCPNLDTSKRIWPSQADREAITARHGSDRLEHDDFPGWEP